MGTSAARQAPSGRYWRRAKIILGRFAANQGDAPRAEEVVAHYSAALHFEAAGSGSELLAAMGATAADLAEFYRIGLTHGWLAALGLLGLANLTPRNPSSWWPQLVERLAGIGASLAQATARTALIAHFAAHFNLEASCPQEVWSLLRPEQVPHLLVDYLGRFLATGLLVDLGEILELRAPQVKAAHQCRLALQEAILARLHRLAAFRSLLASQQEEPPALQETIRGLIALLAQEAGHE